MCLILILPADSGVHLQDVNSFFFAVWISYTEIRNDLTELRCLRRETKSAPKNALGKGKHFQNQLDFVRPLPSRLFGETNRTQFVCFVPQKQRPKRVKAIYNCVADNPDELTFSEGEVIVVDGEEDQEWWVSISATLPVQLTRVSGHRLGLVALQK